MTCSVTLVNKSTGRSRWWSWSNPATSFWSPIYVTQVMKDGKLWLIGVRREVCNVSWTSQRMYHRLKTKTSCSLIPALVNRLTHDRKEKKRESWQALEKLFHKGWTNEKCDYFYCFILLKSLAWCLLNPMLKVFTLVCEPPDIHSPKSQIEVLICQIRFNFWMFLWPFSPCPVWASGTLSLIILQAS